MASPALPNRKFAAFPRITALPAVFITRCGDLRHGGSAGRSGPPGSDLQRGVEPLRGAAARRSPRSARDPGLRQPVQPVGKLFASHDCRYNKVSAFKWRSAQTVRAGLGEEYSVALGLALFIKRPIGSRPEVAVFCVQSTLQIGESRRLPEGDRAQALPLEPGQGVRRGAEGFANRRSRPLRHLQSSQEARSQASAIVGLDLAREGDPRGLLGVGGVYRTPGRRESLDAGIEEHQAELVLIRRSKMSLTTSSTSLS